MLSKWTSLKSFVVKSGSIVTWFASFTLVSTNTFKEILLGLYNTIPNFNDLGKKPFENTTGKGENAGNQHFLLCLQCFKFMYRRISISKLHLLSANAFKLDQSKHFSFGKEFIIKWSLFYILKY